MFSWDKDPSLANLLKLAIFLIIITLTRYEGYIVLFASIILVIGLSHQREKKYKLKNHSEATSLIFITLSIYGVILWMIYLGIIFHDPFIWLKEYTQHVSTITSTTGLTKNIFNNVSSQTTVRPNYSIVIRNYLLGTLLVNGIITTILGFIYLISALIVMVLNKRINKTIIIPFIYLLSITFFMIASKSAPVIHISHLSWNLLLKTNLSYTADINMRFGLALLPFITLFYIYFFSKNTMVKILGMCIVVLQLVITYLSPVSLYYELPQQFRYQPLQDAQVFKKMYNGGLVLISDHAHDYFIFDSGLAYHTFIHEGTQKYWKTSLINPTTYATWIIYDENSSADTVRNYLQNIRKISQSYDLVYHHNGFKIYKIKNKPKFNV